MTSILFLAADPSNASRLRLGEEFREIQEKLKLAKLREQFRLELPQLSIRPADISQALLDEQPQIVHFSGHGTPTGALCFENQVGEAHLVQPDALAELFELFANQVNCVLLSACYSEKQAKAIAKHIKYVIGMNQAISDGAAIAFAIGFYQALGAGWTIEKAYKLGLVQIRLQNIPGHLIPVLIKKENVNDILQNITEDEEEGFLDLLKTGKENFESMNEIIDHMTNALGNLNDKTNSGTDELDQIKSQSRDIDIEQAKEIIDRMAEALDNFVDLMEVDAPMFADSYSNGMDAYSRAITLLTHFSPQDKENLKNVQVFIRQLISATIKTKGGMLAIRNTMASAPSITVMYNKAKKRALSILDKLDEEFATALNIASEVEKSINQLITE